MARARDLALLIVILVVKSLSADPDHHHVGNIAALWKPDLGILV